MNPKNKGLGRGLGAIFDMEGTVLPEKSKSRAFEEIEIDRIQPNPKQPRSHFAEEALEELAESIRTLGVIQPITVKKETDGTYTLISGERRWRASQKAGLTVIPAYIREADDQTLLEMAIVENIQRQDLNAIEVALSLQRLVDECRLTQDSLAERVGKKTVYGSQLHEAAQTAGRDTAGHSGRAHLDGTCPCTGRHRIGRAPNRPAEKDRQKGTLCPPNRRARAARKRKIRVEKR